MSKYYFLGCVFPPVQIGQTPEITFEEFSYLLKMNLSPADLGKVAFLKRFIDLKNIRALWVGEALDLRGNYTEKELNEALSTEELFPEYLAEFLDTYEQTHERLKNFSYLWSQYFVEAEKKKGFISTYLRFEREVSLVLTALRAKQLKRDVTHELQFEDFQDPFVAHILVQKDLDHYDPPVEYAALKELYMEHQKDPWALHKALLSYRMKKLLELEENREFSIDSVLAYMVRLMLVEDFDQLDREKGKKLLKDIA